MNLRFVLVEPKVPENIGASARAIKTMGFSNLVLINPCEWRDGKSKWVAHGSAGILDNTKTFSTLEEALSDSDFSVATSARQRTVKQNYIPARDLKGFLDGKKGSADVISIVFGREESGLTNEEMKLCDVTSTIPMNGSYPSLNLSHAVMIFAWELSGFCNHQARMNRGSDNDSFRQLKVRINEILLTLGIDEDDNRYGRIMERVAFLENDDINLMHTISSMILENLKSG